MKARRLAVAALVLAWASGCAWWIVVLSFLWAFRDFVLCWSPCQSRADAIVGQRTAEALALTVLLALNLVMLAILAVKRERAGLIMLASVQAVNLAATAIEGLRFMASGDPGTALQWWSGSALAVVALALIFFVIRFAQPSTPSSAPKAAA